MDKLVVDVKTGVQYNPYSKHHPGRHVCTRNAERPVKSKQAYCKPTFKNYVVNCQGNQVCKGVRLVYETHYKDVLTTRTSNEVIHLCCPGWTQTNNRSHGCHKASCSKPCLNGGKCVKPELCACLKGFSGQQCEITLNIPKCHKPCLNGGKCVKGNICSCLKGFGGSQCELDFNKPQCSQGCENGGTCARHEVCKCPKGFTGRYCEQDIDECKEEKPCDQICYNNHGSYSCHCREDFVLQNDGQSCRKEGIDDGGLEAKDLEFEMLDKRLLKLETMMDESHKNDVSKNDLNNVYKDMGSISEDITSLKNKISDVENYKRDMYVFKNKLNRIEKKAEQVDELIIKYDRIKKCAFYNKICM
nr:fibropellin-1-like [Leptinotarsa decemlineata]